jgi:hypothetical protein
VGLRSIVSVGLAANLGEDKMDNSEIDTSGLDVLFPVIVIEVHRR